MRLCVLLGLFACACGTDKVYLDTGYLGSLSAEPSEPSTDADGDGIPDGEDCDDEDADVFPGATESCDGLDNDCDGEVDEGLLTEVYDDVDGDGFGDPTTLSRVCEVAEGQTADNSDCDDSDPEVHPGVEDVCDGRDNDCDLEVDEDADGVTWYLDLDGDGYGDEETAITNCTGVAPEGYAARSGDCDDADAMTYPTAGERCDGIDNDCNGLIDDGVSELWFRDMDGDGAGGTDVTFEGCDPSAGYVDNSDDCDDTSAAVSPWAYEACNGIDDDCDGTIDESDALDAQTWYTDADGDGYGSDAIGIRACDPPSGTVSEAGDCDDAEPAINPGAMEVCNGLDDDCDGAVDADDADVVDAGTYALDADGDGYGSADTSMRSCDVPSGYVDNDTDCDDDDAAISPGADEVCNEVDDDCDGLVDTDDTDLVGAETFYADGDGDGYGWDALTTTACEAPAGFVADDSDCNDADASINPAADELCNEIDDDCDGLIDGLDPSLVDGETYYIDYDGDGFGSDAYTEVACDVPSGFVADDSDCDDLDAEIFPGAEERCNGEDDNCDEDIAWQELDVDGDGYLACQEALWLETSRSYHNDPASSGAYGSLQAARLLSDYGVRSASSVMYSVTVTDELLAGYGVLIVYGQGYDGPFSSAESAALERWVYDGGRLLYVGGWGSGVSCATTNSLPSEFGIACAGAGATWSGTSAISGSHPVEVDVSTISGLGGERWYISPPAATLGVTSGWPTLVVMDHGNGRVVGLADEWPLYNAGTSGPYDIGAYDNRQMVDNIWAWFSDFEL